MKTDIIINFLKGAKTAEEKRIASEIVVSLFSESNNSDDNNDTKEETEEEKEKRYKDLLSLIADAYYSTLDEHKPKKLLTIKEVIVKAKDIRINIAKEKIEEILTNLKIKKPLFDGMFEKIQDNQYYSNPVNSFSQTELDQIGFNQTKDNNKKLSLFQRLKNSIVKLKDNPIIKPFVNTYMAIKSIVLTIKSIVDVPIYVVSSVSNGIIKSAKAVNKHIIKPILSPFIEKEENIPLNSRSLQESNDKKITEIKRKITEIRQETNEIKQEGEKITTERKKLDEKIQEAKVRNDINNIDLEKNQKDATDPIVISNGRNGRAEEDLQTETKTPKKEGRNEERADRTEDIRDGEKDIKPQPNNSENQLMNGAEDGGRSKIATGNIDSKTVNSSPAPSDTLNVTEANTRGTTTPGVDQTSDNVEMGDEEDLVLNISREKVIPEAAETSEAIKAANPALTQPRVPELAGTKQTQETQLQKLIAKRLGMPLLPPGTRSI